MTCHSSFLVVHIQTCTLSFILNDSHASICPYHACTKEKAKHHNQQHCEAAQTDRSGSAVEEGRTLQGRKGERLGRSKLTIPALQASRLPHQQYQQANNKTITACHTWAKLLGGAMSLDKASLQDPTCLILPLPVQVVYCTA